MTGPLPPIAGPSPIQPGPVVPIPFTGVSGGSSSAPDKSPFDPTTTRQLEIILKNKGTAADVRDFLESKGYKRQRPGQADEELMNVTSRPSALPGEGEKDFSGSFANLIDGLTLGTFDAMAGHVTGDPQVAMMIDERVRNYQEHHGKKAFAGQIIGSAPWAAVGGPFNPLLGAVAGAFQTGDDPMKPSVPGAVGGAILGKVAPPILGAAGKVVKGLFGPLFKAALRTAGIKTPAEHAELAMIQRIERDGGFTPFIDAYKAKMASGAPAKIVDNGGTNVMSLMDEVLTLPGSGANTARTGLQERQVDQSGRVMKAIVESLDSKASDINELGNQIEMSRIAAARPFYEAAWKESIKPQRDLQRLMKRSPIIAEAWERGRAIMRMDPSIKTKIPSSQPTYLADGTMREPWMEQDLPIMAFDMMKRGLDDIIASGTNGGRAVGKQEARALRSLRNEILEYVDKKSPNFAKARATAVEGFDAQEALDLGQEAFTKSSSPFSIRKTLREFKTDHERELYRVGALKDVFARLGGGTQESKDYAQLALGGKNSAVRLKLEALYEGLPDGAAQFTRLTDYIDTVEKAMSKSSRLGGGSQTAARTAAHAELTQGGGDLAAMVNRPSATGMMASVASRGVRHFTDRWEVGVRDHLADKLMLEGDEGLEYLYQLQRTSERRAPVVRALKDLANRETAIQAGSKGGPGLGEGLLRFTGADQLVARDSTAVEP